jgi:hypothetical protein
MPSVSMVSETGLSRFDSIPQACHGPDAPVRALPSVRERERLIGMNICRRFHCAWAS